MFLILLGSIIYPHKILAIYKIRLIHILSWIPYSLAKIPYLLCLNLFKILVSSKLSVWHRNSLYFKNISLGISDIDVTIYNPIDDESIIKNILETKRKLKFLLPLIGEVNIYNSKNIKIFLNLINPYELERDKLLIDYLKLEGRHKSEACRLVFLFKMLKSDIYGLSHYPKVRKRKWIKHLKDLNVSFQLSDLDNLEILKNVIYKKLRLNDNAVSVSDHFFTKNNSKEELNKAYQETDNRKEFIVYFTVEWIGCAIANYTFYEDLNLIEEFDNNTQEIILENLRWEIFGIYSQYHEFSSDYEKKYQIQHLGFLSIINDKLQDENIELALDELKSLIKPIRF